MRRLFVLLLAVLLHGMAAAEPVRPRTPAGLQALLNDNPLACKVQRVLNERTQKEELVVECDSYPKDLKLSEVALSYFLNSVDDQGNPLATIEESGAIRLKTGMSQYQFEDGFDQRARDVQKETVFSRSRQAEHQKELAGLTKNLDGLTKSFDDMLSKVGWLEAWIALFFVGLLLSVGAGAYALRYVYRIRSGAWDKDAHAKNKQTLENFLVSKMNEIVKQKQAALDTKVDKESYTVESQAALKRITDLEAKTSFQKQVIDRIQAAQTKEGTTKPASTANPATEEPRKASSGPSSNGGTHTNGNGASKLPDLKAQIPVPNTEETLPLGAPLELPEDTAELLQQPLRELPMEVPEQTSSPDKIQEILAEMRQPFAPPPPAIPEIGISPPDEGEPTKETKLADLHFVDVRSKN